MRAVFIAGMACLLAAGAWSGCRSTAPLPPLDLAAPGWEVRQGQALWRPGGGKPEIAGDVVLSRHPRGDAFVQFSKTLPIVSGRLSPGTWQIEFPPEDKRYSGGGNPPKRLVWLQLLRALEGAALDDRWLLAHPSDRFIALEDPHSGERLEVHFQQ